MIRKDASGLKQKKKGTTVKEEKCNRLPFSNPEQQMAHISGPGKTGTKKCFLFVFTFFFVLFVCFVFCLFAFTFVCFSTYKGYKLAKCGLQSPGRWAMKGDDVERAQDV